MKSHVRKNITAIKIIATALTAIIAIGYGIFLSIQAQAAQVPLKFSIALTGDMPYGAKGATEVPNVIAEINSTTRIKFTLFDSDANE